MIRRDFLKQLIGSIAGLVVGTKIARAAAPLDTPKVPDVKLVVIDALGDVSLVDRCDDQHVIIGYWERCYLSGAELADEFGPDFDIERSTYPGWDYVDGSTVTREDWDRLLHRIYVSPPKIL